MTFFVPESWRVVSGRLATSSRDGNNGAFAIPAKIPGRELWVIASDGEGWEHVSVSIVGRRTAVPNWEEMDYVCRIFWGEEDLVVQYHPRRSKHINYHEGCLHLWRPIGVVLPEPEPKLVGPVEAA